MLNKAFQLYVRGQEYHVDIEIPKVPIKDASEWMQKLPADGKKLVKNAANEAARAGQKLSDISGKSLDLPENVTHRIINDPALERLTKQATMPSKTTVQMAEDARKLAAAAIKLDPKKTKNAVNEGLKNAEIPVRL